MENLEKSTPQNFSNKESYIDDVSEINFSKSEVLHSFNQRKERDNQLKKALKIGKNNETPVRIKFRNENYKLIEISSPIWGLTDNYIILLSATLIPIKSVVEVVNE